MELNGSSGSRQGQNHSAPETNDKTSTDDDGLHSFLLVCQSISILLIIIASATGNVLVFFIFHKKKSKLMTVSNRFILNLAVGDGLMTIFVMPMVFFSVVFNRWIFGPEWCQVVGVTTTMLFVACTMTLSVIALDRYSAIMSPLHYTMRMTSTRANYIIIGIWLLSFAFGLMPVVGWNHIEYSHSKYLCTVQWRTEEPKFRSYTYFLACAVFALPLLIMLWVYAKIFRAAQRTSARARRNSVQPDLCVTPASEEIVAMAADGGGQNPRRRRSGGNILLLHRDDWKAAKTGLIVTSSFLFCWLPFFVIITVESSAKCVAIPKTVEGLSIWMALVGCALNPLVYVFRNKSMRREIRKLCRSHCDRSRHPRRTRTIAFNGNSDSDIDFGDACSGKNNSQQTLAASSSTSATATTCTSSSSGSSTVSSNGTSTDGGKSQSMCGSVPKSITMNTIIEALNDNSRETQ